MKIILHSLLSIFLGSLFMVGFPALAQTPDGFTPADEMVCDGLKADGTTKGLYGLCVAYCEATDSPEDLTNEELIASIPTRSAKILANYNKKKTEADPQMPCATYYKDTSCVAWTLEQRDTVGTYGYQEIREDDATYTFGTTHLITDREQGPNDDNTRWGRTYLEVYTGLEPSGEPFYGAGYGNQQWCTPLCGIIIDEVNSVELTMEQYDECTLDIINHVMP